MLKSSIKRVVKIINRGCNLLEKGLARALARDWMHYSCLWEKLIILLPCNCYFNAKVKLMYYAT